MCKCSGNSDACCLVGSVDSLASEAPPYINFFGNVVNIGTNKENKISDIIKIVQKNLDKKVKIVKKNERVRPSKSEVIRLRCNNNYIIKNSSWKPRITLEKGILNTTEWIKKNVSKEIISKYIV